MAPLALSSLLLILFMGATVRPALARASTASCLPFQDVPVALALGQPLSYTIHGQLCNPARGPSATVQLLVSGATYGSIYWNFPSVDGVAYSYTAAMNAAGFSTFNIDRLGIGGSSHPPAGDVTIDAEAYILHELVLDLRAGSISGQAFARVLLAGHSLGSGIVWDEAGSYHDVAGVIVTGLAHTYNATALGNIFASTYPAGQDPRFAGQSWASDPEYLTTQPGTRGSDFYYQPGADPNVIATDEETKETATVAEGSSFGTILTNGISGQITVPVLLVLGQQDSIFCGPGATNCSSPGAVKSTEGQYYSPQAQLQVVVVPNVGHDLNLHDRSLLGNIPGWYVAAAAWAYYYVGP